jgi:hypothetical protein
MRKIILQTFMLFLYGFTNGQFTAEIMSGLTSSVVKEKQTENYSGFGNSFSRRFSFHFGALTGVYISEYTKFKTGLIYSSRGTALEGAVFPFGTTINQIKLGFLEIPFLYVIEPGAVSVFIGPQYSTLLSASDSDGNEFKSSFNNSSVDIRYGIGVVGRKFGTYFHLVTGLTDILKSDDLKWRSNAFCVGLSYSLIAAAPAQPKRDRKQKEFDIPHRRID